MLAHNIKDILTKVPEAMNMVKQANLEEDFPSDSKDSVSASYLRVHYLEKIAGKDVDEATVKKITKAAELYGVKDVLDTMVTKFSDMEKKASVSTNNPFKVSLSQLEANFEGNLGGLGFLGIEKAASAAKAIYAEFGDAVKSEAVLRYAGHGWLNKQAAIMVLANRYHATKEPAFVKVARLVMDNIIESDFNAISNLCDTVQSLDKQAGLDIIGFNFYKEALYTKEADLLSSMTVKIDGKSVPWESIQKFGKDRIGSILGADVAKAMTGDAATDKAMLESLPADSQKMLAGLVKGC